MLWPLLLLLASVIAAAVGWVALLAGMMASAPATRFSSWTLLAWLFPAGVIGVVVAVVWLLVLSVRWLA